MGNGKKNTSEGTGGERTEDSAKKEILNLASQIALIYAL